MPLKRNSKLATATQGSSVFGGPAGSPSLLRFFAKGSVVLSALALLSHSAAAETMSSALSRAYQGNPNLNQQRASLRATDENLPRANAGWLPTATATASGGYNYIDENLGSPVRGSSAPFTAGLTVNQNLFNGNRTTNSVRQATSNILGARETLRNVEESTLLDGSTAYMNVLRDTAILDLRRNNIIVLEEQLRQTRDRFEVGEVTRTDVAQAQASLASARSDYFTAQANLSTSIATFRQVIGVEPKNLEAARPVEALLPNNLPGAITLALSEHPAVQAALHAVDAAELQVKLVEGELYPTVGLTGTIQEAPVAYQGISNYRAFNAAVLGQVSIPIYAGGEVYARVRQSKELLAQSRLQADQQRDAVRAAVVSTWGQLDTAKAVILSSQAAVKAAEIALNGIREEARVGQRTTFDVLTAQQTLLNARVALVTAQRDRVVASYSVLSSIGKLTATNLNLAVTTYDPTIHLDQVKDKWYGLRTPDGR